MLDQSVSSGSRLIVLGVVMAISSIAHADVVFNVDTVDDRIDDDTSDGLCHTSVNTCSLRAAIMQTNTLTVPITRIAIPAGAFVLTRPPSGTNGDLNGDLDLTAPLVGGQRVIITGAGAALSIIDANQIDRVLEIAVGRDVEINGVTIRNGVAATGAGLMVGGTLLLDNSVVEGNSSATSGGGINNYGYVEIRRSTIRSNFSASGGGLYGTGTTTVKNSIFHGNGASVSGGAITYSDLDLVTSVFTALNSTFSQNYANRNGGAIYSLSDAFLYNCTVVGNDADHDRDELGGVGGGVFVGGGRAVVVNTLIADNTIRDAPIPDNCIGTLEAYGWNLLDDFIGCTFTGNGTAARGFIAPATIAPLQDNGGPTLTHALLPGSQAIDTTFPQGCIDNTGALLTSDQRGALRVAGARCDVGAFEYGAALDVIFRNGFE